MQEDSFKKEKRKGRVIFSLIFGLFFMMVFPSVQLDRMGELKWSWSYLGVLVLGSAVMGIAFGFLWVFLWERFGKKRSLMAVSGKGRFLPSFLGILFFWMPAYLAYYPGICSYDITIQGEQMLSHQYIEHHPLAHTLLVEGFLRLGKMLGNANLGMGIYTFLQMCFLAAAFACGISVLRRRGLGRGYLWALQVYAMFFPFHWYMSLSTTKDSLFAGFVLFFLIFCYQVLEHRNGVFSREGIGFVGSVCGMLLFRNNAKYAFLVFLVIVCVAVLHSRGKKKEEKTLLLLSLAAFLAGLAFLTTLSKATQAVQGDKREMLSIPIQQLARTMFYHSEEISGPDRELVDAFLPDRAYDLYRPDIADPVKKRTVTAVFRYRLPEFLKTYFHLFFRYPGEYLNAVFLVDAGYLSPFDESHARINDNGRDVGLGYVQTRWVEAELAPLGVYKDSKWGSLRLRLEDWADQNKYLSYGPLRYLFMPGSYFWFWLLLFGFGIWKRKQEKLLPVVFMLLYFLTLFLGPTVQLRYLYPLMISLPFAICFMGSSHSDME